MKWEERGLTLESASLHSVAVEPLQDRLARPLFQSLASLPKAPVLTKEGNSRESTGKQKESDILILPSSEHEQTQERACNPDS